MSETCAAHPWNRLPPQRCPNCAIERPRQRSDNSARARAEASGIMRRVDQRKATKAQRKRTGKKRSKDGVARCMACGQKVPPTRKKCDGCKKTAPRPPRLCRWEGCQAPPTHGRARYCDAHRAQAQRLAYERKKARLRVDPQDRTYVRRIRAFGLELTYTEWAERTGMPRHRIYDRIERKGWDPERALTAGTDGAHRSYPRRFIEFGGRRQSLSAWARELGINHSTLAARLRRWPLDVAMTLPKHPRRHGEGYRNAG